MHRVFNNTIAVTGILLLMSTHLHHAQSSAVRLKAHPKSICLNRIPVGNQNEA